MKWTKQLNSLLFVVGIGYSSLSLSAPITFDFSEYRPYSGGAHQYVGSDGDSSVDVTSYSDQGFSYIGSLASTGLYVYSCVDYTDGCDVEDSARLVDGLDAQEAVVLDFGGMVNLISATFSYIGSSDDFTLLLGGPAGAVISSGDGVGGAFATYTFTDAASSEFAFLADHFSDEFSLYSVTAEYVSNVPEPASLSLLGLGLLALGSVRRKK